jgi:hypothetical protein
MKPAYKLKKKKSATCGFVVCRFSMYCAAKSDEQIGLHSNPSINPDLFLQNLVKFTRRIIV